MRYLCLGARVCMCAICLCTQVDGKAQSACVIDITAADTANCNMSEITDAWERPRIKPSDNGITRVNGHCHCLGSNRDVL